MESNFNKDFVLILNRMILNKLWLRFETGAKGGTYYVRRKQCNNG